MNIMINQLEEKYGKMGYRVHISILPAEEGGGYLIEFPDLPGCISDGDTIDEAITNGKDAICCWIETAKLHGDEIPQRCIES